MIDHLERSLNNLRMLLEDSKAQTERLGEIAALLRQTTALNGASDKIASL
jgi:hypothetical protein